MIAICRTAPATSVALPVCWSWLRLGCSMVRLPMPNATELKQVYREVQAELKAERVCRAGKEAAGLAVEVEQEKSSARSV